MLIGQLVNCWSGSLFICKTVILETLRLHFGYPGYHFGDPGIQGVTRSRCRFLVILGSFWESLGSHVGHLFVIVLWFGVPKWDTVCRVMFLVIQGWKWCQNAMAVCAINIVKTNVFERLHFSHLFTDLVSRGQDLDDILVFFRDPGTLFLIFKGPWDRLEIRWLF